MSKNKEFKEIECSTHYKSVLDEEVFSGHLMLGTPVLIFEDGTNSQFGIQAIDLDEKQSIWDALFDNRGLRGYGLVCGENRVLFRQIGANQE